MTTATPLSDTIMDALVSLLASINGADDYWSTFGDNNDGIYVSRVSFGTIPPESPVLRVRYDGEDLDDSGLNSTYTRTRSRLNFTIECYARDVEATADRTIHRLLYDVRKKLQLSSSRQLSGNANNIILQKISKPDRADNGLIYAELSGYVDYYYNSSEPSSR